MKKLLGIVVLVLMLCSSTYALSCDIKFEEFDIYESSGFTILNLYNPTNRTLTITAISYYDSGRSLLRSYNVNYTVRPSTHRRIYHSTSSNLLYKVNTMSVNCR